ncbi:hypothetical protein HMPREF0044_0531 [Gleimia coleocanis DSM 15436]|uniref:ATP synthase F0, B subunit n=1 Tax=Gleimia coleocanis DSM 15436 TaxID=525245 RepID=C0VZE1_9ACTO|nr:hypothetical protein [Gleimia coleocanis]EEH64242.1 hypothetical protein HMPREF0044_0531 [Gleimia coleocanis DSM 15436]
MSHEELDAEVYEDEYYDEGDEYRSSTVIAILDQIENMVEIARALPMSASVLVNKADIIELLAQARESLPDDLQEANGVLADADDLMTRADQQAESTIMEANLRADTLVKEAEEKAIAMVDRARKEAEDLRNRAQEEVASLKEKTANEIETQLQDAQNHADYLISQEAVSQAALARAEEIVAKANDHAVKLADGADRYCSESLNNLLDAVEKIYNQTVAGVETIEARREARRGE